LPAGSAALACSSWSWTAEPRIPDIPQIAAPYFRIAFESAPGLYLVFDPYSASSR